MTLQLTLPKGELATTGKQVTFEAPCESAGLTKLLVQNKTYDLVDSIGNPLAPKAFAKGAMVSVILNNESRKAFIQNPSTTKHLEEQIRQALVPTFKESTTLEKIQSGESLSVLFGKIAKLISDYIEFGGSGGSVDVTMSALTLGADSEVTVTRVAKSDGSYHFTLGIPRGADGKDGANGASPTISVRKSGKTTVLTITNPDGSQTSTKIYDGEDGKDGSDSSIGASVEEVLNALPETSVLDFTEWENGSFTEVLSDGNVIKHGVVLALNGVPTEIGGILISGVS